jgi:hypothetical protein
MIWVFLTWPFKPSWAEQHGPLIDMSIPDIFSSHFAQLRAGQCVLCPFNYFITHRFMTFSDLARFRSFWTFIPSFQLAIKSLPDHPFRLTTSSYSRHNSDKKASIHGSCSDFSFPVHFQLRAHGSCYSGPARLNAEHAYQKSLISTVLSFHTTRHRTHRIK